MRSVERRIAEQTHGRRHPEVAQILIVLAQLQHRLGRPQAKDTAQRALDTLAATLGPEHPITRSVGPELQQIASGLGGEEAEEAPDPTQTRIEAAFEQARAGDMEGAIHALEALVEEAHHVGASGPEASARMALAQLFTATAQPHLAENQLRAALAIVKQLGAEDAAAHIRTMLTALEPPT